MKLNTVINKTQKALLEMMKLLLDHKDPKIAEKYWKLCCCQFCRKYQYLDKKKSQKYRLLCADCPVMQNDYSCYDPDSLFQYWFMDGHFDVDTTLTLYGWLEMLREE